MSKKSPQLRFEGFMDDWEERKLGEIFNYEQPTKYIVKSTEYDDTFNTPVLTAGKSFLLGYTDEITGIKNATVENPVVIFDDFTTGSHYVDFPFKIKSSAMKLLSLNDNSDNFYFMFNTLKNIKYVPQSHERHWISKFSEFEIYKPSQEEQQKIGSFFKQLDDTIALHQRKLDLLKEQKKGFLQKMFPKNGAKVPELRFAGFADDWEERKFSDFTKLSQGLQIAISDRFTEAGPNKEFYITNEFLNPNNTKKYYIENPSKNVIANTNDILMTRTGNTGKVVTNTKGAFHNNFFKIDYDPKKISKLFLYFLLTSIPIQKEILIRAGTSTIPDLNHKDFYKIKVYLPIFEEQQRIGSFFKQLDDTIALHQRKLDLLKEQKKGYLQKMFV
ncbi:restriction endonuclease subunit S [Streptococcus parauberis]|uniref:Type I restriction modification DNA specificity domain protein n=1 Tax=Streptococcus parauberis NCFD 2020 TaxID=873447 RepID=F1YZ66_9STRE|nr:restriction endonuclease subunit S [Streptococcus parauberis]EGE54570.1 type I restriction modification DNA specificity domain protein [Streptococcus parauberis NCFD 2020]